MSSVITDEGSKPTILSSMAQTTAALTRLKPVWNDISTSLIQKIRLMCSLVTSIFLHACESWTLRSRAPERNTSHGNEMLPQDTTHLIQRPCYQRGSPCQDPAGNRITRRPPDHCKKTQTAVVWSCLLFIRSGQNHLARHSERGRRGGRQKKRWKDIKKWTRLEFSKSQRAVENRENWRKLVVKSSLELKQPSELRNR